MAWHSFVKPMVDALTRRSFRISNSHLGSLGVAVVVNAKGSRCWDGSNATKMSTDDFSESANTHSDNDYVHKDK